MPTTEFPGGLQIPPAAILSSALAEADKGDLPKLILNEARKEQDEARKEPESSTTHFIVAHLAEAGELAPDPRKAFRQAEQRYRIISVTDDDKDNRAKAHLRLGLLYLCAPAVERTEDEQIHLALRHIGLAAYDNNLAAIEIVKAIRSSQGKLASFRQALDIVDESIPDTKAGDTASGLAHTSNNRGAIKNGAPQGLASGQSNKNSTAPKGVTLYRYPIMLDWTTIFDNALAKHIPESSKRQKVVHELVETTEGALLREMARAGGEAATPKVQTTLFSDVPLADRTAASDAKTSGKVDLTLARLHTAFELLVRTSDLANPTLTHAERLTRATAILKTYQRIRKRAPDFYSDDNMLKAAKSLWNQESYLRRKAKLEI